MLSFIETINGYVNDFVWGCPCDDLHSGSGPRAEFSDAFHPTAKIRLCSEKHHWQSAAQNKSG